MRATIRILNLKLPYCDAQSSNEILFVFSPPTTGLHVGDLIEFDHKIRQAPQIAQNVSTGKAFTIHLQEMDIHDLRLPAAHGSNRFPSAERFDAA